MNMHWVHITWILIAAYCVTITFPWISVCIQSIWLMLCHNNLSLNISVYIQSIWSYALKSYGSGQSSILRHHKLSLNRTQAPCCHVPPIQVKLFQSSRSTRRRRSGRCFCYSLRSVELVSNVAPTIVTSKALDQQGNSDQVGAPVTHWGLSNFWCN